MFSQACVKNSVHGVGVGEVFWPIACWDTPPDTPPKMTTAADGTHPTGMHSCLHVEAIPLN